MTNPEIKKLYTKTKKAFEKRTGEKHTWVMNAKQQRLGTATVLVAGAHDNEACVEGAKRLADGAAAAMAKKYWLAMSARAEEEARTGGSKWNPTFWRDNMAELGTLDEYMAKYQRKADEELAKAEAYLAQHGPRHEQLKESHEYAKTFIASPEVQAFLKAIGGQASIEDKHEGSSIYTYVRFHYSATDNTIN